MKAQDFPISEQAQRFYRSGGSWLHGYLPFWAATFVDRMLLVLISIGIVLVPLIGILPWLYTWRNRSKIVAKCASDSASSCTPNMKPPSPVMATTGRSGCATLAPSAVGKPEPSVP